jgi:hypothetical protein
VRQIVSVTATQSLLATNRGKHNPSATACRSPSATPRGRGSVSGCGVVDNDRDPCRAASGEHLNQLLTLYKAIIFSLIQ